jgi:hypothetical protein
MHHHEGQSRGDRPPGPGQRFHAGKHLDLWAVTGVDGPINNRIDDAYRVKHHGSPYFSPMIGARARSATIKVMPRASNV